MKAKLDLNTVRQKTEAYLSEMKLKKQVNDVVRDTLKTFEGKVINKRMATAVEKALEAKLGHTGLSVFWRTDFSWNAIRVWGPQQGLPYDSAYDQMINYHSDKGRDGDGRFHYDYWMEKYGGYGGNGKYDEYIARTEVALRQIDQKVNAYNDAYDALEKAYGALEGLAHWSH